MGSHTADFFSFSWPIDCFQEIDLYLNNMKMYCVWSVKILMESVIETCSIETVNLGLDEGKRKRLVNAHYFVAVGHFFAPLLLQVQLFNGPFSHRLFFTLKLFCFLTPECLRAVRATSGKSERAKFKHRIVERHINVAPRVFSLLQSPARSFFTYSVPSVVHRLRDHEIKTFVERLERFRER